MTAASDRRAAAERGVLVLSCPDRPGIVAAVAGEIAAHGANIVHADQHLDAAHGLFLQRIEIELGAGTAGPLRHGLTALAERLGMRWELHVAEPPEPVAILVSRQGHCLDDLLARIARGDVRARVAVVASNHPDHSVAAERFGVPFAHVPVDADEPAAQEDRLLRQVQEAGARLVVLARYMRILSERFLDAFPDRVINVHHSFLPAFAGARAYHQAYERGVKLIGATAHYATTDLDAGPIIVQDVTPVTHRDDVDRFVQEGRDLEQRVLARALRLHLEHRVLVYANRTVVFD